MGWSVAARSFNVSRIRLSGDANFGATHPILQIFSRRFKAVQMRVAQAYSTVSLKTPTPHPGCTKKMNPSEEKLRQMNIHLHEVTLADPVLLEPPLLVSGILHACEVGRYSVLSHPPIADGRLRPTIVLSLTGLDASMAWTPDGRLVYTLGDVGRRSARRC